MDIKLLSTKFIEPLTTSDIEFLYNELRKSSIVWSGRKEVLKNARKKVFVKRAKNGNPVYKFHWQCADCKKWKKSENEVEVDHIVEIGGVTEFAKDILQGIHRMFPRPVEKHLQVLCLSCHSRKTTKYNCARIMYVRKVKE